MRLKSFLSCAPRPKKNPGSASEVCCENQPDWKYVRKATV